MLFLDSQECSVYGRKITKDSVWTKIDLANEGRALSHGADKNIRHEAENIEADYGSKNG